MEKQVVMYLSAPIEILILASVSRPLTLKFDQLHSHSPDKIVLELLALKMI